MILAVSLCGCDVYDTSLLQDGGALDVAPEACAKCNGTCVDLQTDIANCGACGAVCEVGCAGGYCKPTVLAPNLAAPHGLVLNGSSAYFAQSNSINVSVMSKTDGAGLANFATGQLQPDRLATDGTNLYWSDDVNLSSTPGGAIEFGAFTGATINCTGAYCYYVQNLPSPYGIAVQNGVFFFTTLDATNNAGGSCAGKWTNSVLSCPVAGYCAALNCATTGGPTVIASGQTKLASVAADTTNVYWADTGAHVVRYCPQPACTGGPQIFAQNLEAPFDVVSNGTNVYFTDRQAGSLYMCPKSGCNGAPSAIASGLGDPFLIALDTTNIFVTRYQTGSISMCALPSCSQGAVTIATGLHGPYGIASDGTYVYWTEEGSAGPLSGDGTVSRLKIP